MAFKKEGNVMKRVIAMVLLFVLSLSMWGCNSNASSTSSSQKPSRPKSSISNQQPNNNSGNGNNASPSTKIDPNGFSSLEQIAGAIVAMQTGTATKEQLRKLYPEAYWNEYIPFDQFYLKYLSTAADTKESLEKQYGANYTVTYSVISYELETDYGTKNISESENQEFFEWYCADLRERCDYRVTISITISGSITEDTKRLSVYFKKIGSKWYG